MVYEERCQEGIVKVEVQNGWEPHMLDPLQTTGLQAVAHPSWNYAYAKYARFLAFFGMFALVFFSCIFFLNLIFS